MLGAAAALRRTIGARPSAGEPDADAIYSTVRGIVGDEGLSSGIAEGETWSLEHAVAEASEIASIVASVPIAGVVSQLTTSMTSMVSAPSPAAQRLGLTARELEVLGYLVQRYTDREIAARVDDQPPYGDDARRADPHQARRRRSPAGGDGGDAGSALLAS